MTSIAIILYLVLSNVLIVVDANSLVSPVSSISRKHYDYSDVGIVSSQFRSYEYVDANRSPKSKTKLTEPLIFDAQPHHISNVWTRTVRSKFVRRVYSIFTVQILTTVVITSIIMNNPSLRYFLQSQGRWIAIVSSLICTGIVAAFSYNEELRYKKPRNLILLGVFTLLQSIMVGTFSSFFDPRLVCIGSMHTLFVLLAITLYSMQPNPRYDLTTAGSTLLAALTSLVVGSLLGLIFRFPIVDNIISGLLAVVFAGYIVYDTQLIFGGGKKSFDPKDYIMAALGLYQDVLSFFVQVIKLLHKLKKDNEEE